MLTCPARFTIALSRKGITNSLIYTLTPVLTVRAKAIVWTSLIACWSTEIFFTLAFVGFHTLAMNADLVTMCNTSVSTLDIPITTLLNRSCFRQSLGCILGLELQLVLGTARWNVQAPRVNLPLDWNLLRHPHSLVVWRLPSADVRPLQRGVGLVGWQGE